MTALVYWVLVLGIWGLFGMERGLNHELAFPVNSMRSPGWEGFLYTADPLRSVMNIFYHLSYLLSGNSGGYGAYQIVYGVLWWARGLLVFLIFRRVWPSSPVFAFVAGAMAIVHASDGAINWVGQLNQFGMMFWLALAVYLFVEASCRQRFTSTAALLLLSLVPLGLSLWSYESQIFIVLTIPFLLFVAHRRLTIRYAAMTAVWYILPTVYIWRTLQYYLAARSSTYQESVMRSSFSPEAISWELVAHLVHSLRFWEWSAAVPIHNEASLATPIAAVCAAVFVAGAHLLSPAGLTALRLPPTSGLLLALGAGSLILVLSFPIYLLLAGSTNFWRTQMLSSFGAAIVLCSGFLLLARLAQRLVTSSLGGTWSAGIAPALAIALSAVVVFAGVRAGIRFGAFHHQGWELHRAVMSQVAHLAPDLEPNTLVLLTNVPKAPRDPLGAAIWFDFQLQYLYPGRQIAGYYLYDSGEHPSDNPWDFTSSGMSWGKQGMRPRLETVTYDRIVALRHNFDGRISLLDEFPAELLPQPFDTSAYDPEQRISRVLVPDRSIRMFAR